MDLKIAPKYPPNEVDASLAVAAGSAIRCRVWCSPQTHKHPYVWEWAVDNGEDTLEFGREKTEEDAKREAEEARADWQRILSPNK